MAENKESKSSGDVGFFHYDWALSRYKWMDGNCFSKVSGFGPVKKMTCSSSEVKAQVGGNHRKRKRQTKKGGKSFCVGKFTMCEEIIIS